MLIVPPLIIVCSIISLGGLICLGFLFTKKRRIGYVAGFILSFPFLGLISAILFFELKQAAEHPSLTPLEEKEQTWQDVGGTINGLVADYYYDHPDRFRFLRGDDEAEADAEFLSYLGRFLNGSGTGFMIRDGKLFSPYGDQAVIVIDHDKNLVLEARGYKFPYSNGEHYACALLRLDPNASPERWTRMLNWFDIQPINHRN